MKSILKATVSVLVAILGVSFIYIFGTIVLSVIAIEGKNDDELSKSVYLKLYEHHSEIIVPLTDDVYDWTNRMSVDSNECIDSCRYVAFGWGHEEFYLTTPSWSEFKIGTALKALFGIGSSVMHVSFYGAIPQNSISLSLSKRDLKQMVEFIDSSFVKDPSGEFVLIRRNANGSRFYKSNRKYSMFYTCNSWVNVCLKRAKQTACFWTPLVKGLEYQYKVKSDR